MEYLQALGFSDMLGGDRRRHLFEPKTTVVCSGATIRFNSLTEVHAQTVRTGRVPAGSSLPYCFLSRLREERLTTHSA